VVLNGIKIIDMSNIEEEEEEEESKRIIEEESERISKLLTDMLSEEYIESISIFKRYFVYFIISFFLFIVVIFFILRCIILFRWLRIPTQFKILRILDGFIKKHLKI
jgi:hypothetical protein